MTQIKKTILFLLLSVIFQTINAATGPNILGGDQANGDMLEVTITENGGVVPRKWALNFGSTTNFNWQRTYYSLTNGNGISLWNETTCLMQGGYFTSVGARTISLSEKTTNPDGSETITRTWTGTGGAAGGIIIIETFYLYKGANYYTRTIEIQNNSGVDLENVRLYLGGDVYFSGSDSSFGNINFDDGAVYCYRNAEDGIMTLQGIYPLPTYYHAAHYSTNGRDRVITGNNLGNITHPASLLSPIDTGYYLQWGDRNEGDNSISISNGGSYTIETMESFTCIHNFLYYLSDNNATCLADGTETAACTRCPETDTRTEADSKLEHAYTAQGELVSAATCTTPAIYRKKCVNGCNLEHESETIEAGEIDAANHTGEQVVRTPATCTTEGIKEWNCCQTAGDAIQIDETAHNFSEWETTTAATCEAAGEETEKCSACGALGTETQAIDQLTNGECLHTAITDITQNTGIKVYPNPVKDILTIENGELKIESIRIVDLSGKTLLFSPSQQFQINVSNLPNDIYFIKIETNNGIVTQKFVKE